MLKSIHYITEDVWKNCESTFYIQSIFVNNCNTDIAFNDHIQVLLVYEYFNSKFYFILSEFISYTTVTQFIE